MHANLKGKTEKKKKKVAGGEVGEGHFEVFNPSEKKNEHMVAKSTSDLERYRPIQHGF